MNIRQLYRVWRFACRAAHIGSRIPTDSKKEMEVLVFVGSLCAVVRTYLCPLGVQALRLG